MEKRGLSHVEMVLAFVLFIGAVGFALYFFSTTFNEPRLDAETDFTFNQIIKNSTTSFEKYTVKILPGAGSTVAINLSREISSNEKVIVKSQDEKNLNVYVQGGLIYVERPSNEEVVFIFIGTDFNDNYTAITLPAHNSGFYEVGSRIIVNVPSEKKLLELNKTYYQDYNLFKQALGIGREFDLSFSASFDSQDYIKTEQPIPLQTNVFVKTERKEIVKLNGELAFADIKITVW